LALALQYRYLVHNISLAVEHGYSDSRKDPRPTCLRLRLAGFGLHTFYILTSYILRILRLACACNLPSRASCLEVFSFAPRAEIPVSVEFPRDG